MDRYLVTGGAGFIGSNIVDTLLKRGNQVVVLDNFSTGKWENIERIIRIHGLQRDKDFVVVKGEDKINRRYRLEVIEGDLRNLNICRRAVQDVTYVLHQGALPSVPRSVTDPATTNDVNIRGTLNMLLAARDGGVKRFIFASSSSVYGDTPVLPKVETMPGNPLSPYALSKLTGEFYSILFYKLYGLSTVSLRYFNIFGPAQDPSSQYAAVIPKFITSLLAGKSPHIYGDGEQSRDFTYVADCVKANLLACVARDVSGEVFNVAGGKKTTVNELFHKIRDILNSQVKPEYRPPRPGDIRHSLADISKAEKLLGYRPEVSLEEGLRNTVEWFRSSLPVP